MLVKPEPINAKHASDGIHDPVAHAFQTLIDYYGGSTMTDSEAANFADTPKRAAKAFRDLVWPKSKIVEELTHQLKTGFPLEDTTDQTDLVVQGPIGVHSLCPHHMLAVEYEVFVACKPVSGGTVLGLSKYARVAQTLGKRPVLQEQLTRDIADVLHFHEENESSPFPQIESEGSAVQLLGRHSCMSCRGVKENAVTLTTALRGVFHNPSLKAEFYQAIESIRRAK